MIQVLRWVLTQAYFDHSSNQDADHVTEKAVALNFEDEFAPFAVPIGCIDSAGKLFGNGILFTKCAKAVRAF